MLDALAVQAGDQLELEEDPDGYTSRPRRIVPTRLATLRAKTRPGHPPFDLETFRSQPIDRRFGIDSSVLVRLLTGEPAADFDYRVSRLTQLVRDHGAEVFASNQVIGEAYIAVQHHQGVSKADPRAGLVDVLRSGLVAPLNGRSVFAALEASDSAGLFDRLIANDYDGAGLQVLTLDRNMAGLSNARRLRGEV